MGLPERGTVLGIDVGYSATQRTTAFCRLDWDARAIRVRHALATADPVERRALLQSLLSDEPMLAGVAVDGPLAPGLAHVTRYRAAEALLSQGRMQKRGKPGQTSSPVGQQLHAHATQLAALALDLVPVASATHYQAVMEQRVVEAFPNAFLASLIPEAQIPALARDASDRYWELAAQSGGMLETLMVQLLPGRALTIDPGTITHHDHRAGVVCALTALTVAADRHVAVGDDVDGDIMLPPLDAWGPADHGDPWLQRELLRAIARLRPGWRPGSTLRIADAQGPWPRS